MAHGRKRCQGGHQECSGDVMGKHDSQASLRSGGNDAEHGFGERDRPNGPSSLRPMLTDDGDQQQKTDQHHNGERTMKGVQH